jgi:hypothetical protein
MSITFTSNVKDETVTSSEEACLCAQMSELWSASLTQEGVREDLAAEANPKCPLCKGTGVESVPTSDAPSINWANANAHAVMGVLGFTMDYYGDMPITEARRALLRGRNRSDLSAYTRPVERIYGQPRANEDGSVELRPLRMHTFGLDTEDLASRVEQFASFVEESERRGATQISWD